jgi:SAM-dependent methyltransferase
MTAEPRIPPEVARIDYVARWREIVERRRAQMDAAYAAAGRTSDDYWASRAQGYRRATRDSVERDPLYQRVRATAGGDDTLLDVGAGTGRHTVALAAHVKHVTAVDPSGAMLALLQEDVRAQGIANVEVVQAEWMQAGVAPADYVICSHVLYPIADVVPFVRKLAAHARKRVFIALRADPMATDFGLWAEFYGVPLQHQPVHMDLLNVLAQIGIFADVEVAEFRFPWVFDSVEGAYDEVNTRLCLREDDGAAHAKLRRLLEERLTSRADGRVEMEHAGGQRTAVLSWVP